MVILFDLNGTLLDTGTLAPLFQRIFAGKYSAREWFGDTLRYSMAITMAGRFQPFGDLAADVLRMAAAAHGVEPGRSGVRELREAMLSLPPFPEVKGALARLKAGSYRLAVLSNSSSSALNKQIRNAGLDRFFERAISVDTVEKYKPAPEPYRAAARILGVRPGEVLMAAAHPWDLLGAAGAGCRTALIRRPGTAPWPGAPAPDIEAGDLDDLAGRVGKAASGGRLVPFVAATLAAAIAGGILYRGAGRRGPHPSTGGAPTSSL